MVQACGKPPGICRPAAAALLTGPAFAFVPNETLVAAIALANGFRLTGEATFAHVEGRVLFHADRIKDRAREDICAAMGRLCGPEGSNAPDLALKVK